MKPLPEWAKWMMCLGSWLATQQHSRPWWICLTVPDRRFASLLIAAGYVSSISHGNAATVDERVGGLAVDDLVSWVDSHGELRCGKVTEIRPNSLMLSRRDHRGFETISREKLRSHCDTVHPLRRGEEPFVGGKPRSERLEFVASAVADPNPSMLVCPSESVAVVGVLSDLEDELSSDLLECDGSTGRLVDLVRPHDRLPRGERSHTALVAASADFDRLEDLPEPRLLVFDGAQGYDRLRDSLTAHTSIVILDRWAPRSAYTASSIITERSLQFIEGAEVPLPPPIAAVEIMAWEYER